MTAPTFFTVVADYKSVVVDLASDVDADPQLGPITAKVTFTPVLAKGDVILATNASPRPTGYLGAPIVARIDADGRLKLRVEPDGDRDDFATTAAFPATGTTAKVYYAINTQTFYRWDSGSSQYVETLPYAEVRLLADTPILELDSDLYYRVNFSEVVFNGQSGYISPFTFQAPTSDTVLNLIEVTPVPGQPASGITKIAPGAVRAEDGNLIFSFGGVDLDEPVPYTDVDVTLDAADISDGTATGRALITAANAAAARATLSTLGVDTAATGAIGVRTKTSTTYGTGYVFGTGASFGFSGTGSPPEIAGAFGIYQEFGKADPGETIHKTTQGGYCIAAYFGPTDDDVMECLSAITILSDPTTVGGSGGYIQNQRVAGFECGVQVFGANRIQPDGVQESYASGCGSKIAVRGTSFIDRAYAYRAAWDQSSTGTVREWAAFYQATSPGASATGPKYGVYVIDPIVSETSVLVGKGGSTGEFSVNRTGGADSSKSFMLLSLPSQADAGGASCSGIRIIAASDHSGKNLQQWEKSGEATPYLRVGSTGILQGRTGFTLVDSTFSTSVVNINSAGIQLADTKVIELGHASDTTLSRSAAGKLAVEGVDVLLTGGALGTPSSGTLTNATGLPVSGITASTATALGVGSVELGHASDTTLSRSSAGKLAVEGVDVLLNGGALGTPSSGTLTNCTFPTLNQNTTGTASNVTGTVALGNGGTGQTTAAAAITALTGSQTAGRYLRSDGTNAALAAIDAADVPTLNQNTTGNAATATTLQTARTISGVSFNGSANIDVTTPKTVGQNYFAPGYVSGQYYFANSVQATNTSAIQGNGTVRLTPWIVTADITITRLFAEFTAVGDAASIYHVGIWAHDAATGKPTTLVLDAGSISTGSGDAGTIATGGTPGVYELTVSQALTAGIYWVGGAVQGVTTTQPTMRIVNTTANLYIPLGASLPAAAATFGGMAIGGQTGALATTSAASVSSVGGARIGFKVS
jgi:hypothetical protein